MPLLSIPGEIALENRKRNPYGTWPDRDGGANRVEPIAKPAFDIAIGITRGETIYTIGSCFARNIEQLLEEKGFDVPVRRLRERTDLKLETEGLLNNYAVPSILQELEAAFDPKCLERIDSSFFQVEEGRFVDMNLSHVLRPESFETVCARRKAIIDSTRSIARCRLVIITLGLAEVWFDKETGLYLNETPRNSFVRRCPGRFELRVLEYEETVGMLQRAMELIRDNALPGAQIILTVSPVPLAATHRRQDVMTANTYSKSMLRTACEAVTIRNGFVHYYPSYESVVLSDRQRAWRDDMTHVTPELVGENVNRLVRACTQGEALSLEAVEEKLAEIKSARPIVKWAFFEDHKDLVPLSQDMCYQYAKAAMALGYFDEARWGAELLPAAQFPYLRELTLAEIGVAEKQWDDARLRIEALAEVNRAGRDHPAIWRHVYRLRMLLYVNAQDIDHAISAGLSWSNLGTDQKQVALPLVTLARELKKVGAFEKARSFFEKVIALGFEENRDRLDYAEVLIHVGDSAAAAGVLEGLEPANVSEARVKSRLCQWI